MPSVDSSIQWYEDKKGKVTYSMTDRRGPSSYDCSSSVYCALIQGGFFPSSIYIGNTDTLFNDLEAHGWTQLPPNAQGNFDTQRGDIFIWGNRGDSIGSQGHTGIFIDTDNIDHCSYGYNGIATSNYDWLHSINGNPPQTFYRYTGGEQAPANAPNDQVVEIGSYIKFTPTYTVDDMQTISDVWQVRTNALCPVGFTWADNGIPAVTVTEVDSENFATSDQVLDIGSKYVIPGKFLVSDVGQSGDRWLAKINCNGFDLWIDLETATEVASDDPGTPTPSQKPAPIPPISVPVEPPKPVEQPVTPEPTPAPVTEPTPVVEPPAQPSKVVKKGNIVQEIVSQLESNKTILVNVVVTFFQTALAAWAMTNFAVDKLALTGAIGAGVSAVWNIVIKPSLKALAK